MTKSIFIQGLVAGVMSSAAGVAYQRFYQEMYYLDFSLVVNSGAIISASMIGCMLMALGYFALFKLNRLKWMGWMNLLYAAVSFVSIVPAMTMTLPFEIEYPELLPGMVVPMHFFPVLAVFTISPFFKLKTP